MILHNKPGGSRSAYRSMTPVGEFFRRGSYVATSMLLPGLRALVVLALAATVSPSVVTAIGASQTALALVFAVAGGFTIYTVGVLSRPVDGVAIQGLKASSRAIGLSITAGLLLFVASGLGVGTMFLVYGSSTPAWIGLLGLVPVAITLPYSQVLSGMMQTTDCEGPLLRISLFTTALAMVLSGASIWLFAGSNSAVVLAISLSVTAAELGSIVWKRHYARRALGAFDRTGWEFFRSEFSTSVRELPMASVGSHDVLVMLAVFNVAIFAAHTAGEIEGAAIATLITVVRVVVIPLKAFGVVGGRLIRKHATAEHHSAELSALVREIAKVTALVTTTTVALAVVWHLWGLWDSNLWTVLILLVAVQFAIEPISGVAASALKVLTRPSATVGALVSCMSLIALPGILLSSSFAWGAIGVWTSLVVSRLVFTVLVLHTWARWNNSILERAPA